MKPSELPAIFEIEASAMRETLSRLEPLLEQARSRGLHEFEVAAAGVYLANLYAGLERPLKRLAES